MDPPPAPKGGVSAARRTTAQPCPHRRPTHHHQSAPFFILLRAGRQARSIVPPTAIRCPTYQKRGARRSSLLRHRRGAIQRNRCVARGSHFLFVHHLLFPPRIPYTYTHTAPASRHGGTTQLLPKSSALLAPPYVPPARTHHRCRHPPYTATPVPSAPACHNHPNPAHIAQPIGCPCALACPVLSLSSPHCAVSCLPPRSATARSIDGQRARPPYSASRRRPHLHRV